MNILIENIDWSWHASDAIKNFLPKTILLLGAPCDLTPFHVAYQDFIFEHLGIHTAGRESFSDAKVRLGQDDQIHTAILFLWKS